MAIEPSGTLRYVPDLNEGQWDTQFQRLELTIADVRAILGRRLGLICPQANAATADEITTEIMAAVYFGLAPEEFAGDRQAAYAEAKRVRATREDPERMPPEPDEGGEA